MTTIANQNKSKVLSGVVRALGIIAIVGAGAIATAETADAGGKHYKKHHGFKHSGYKHRGFKRHGFKKGYHFKFQKRRNFRDHAYYKGGKNYCHYHGFKKRGFFFHKKVKCHFHQSRNDRSIKYIR